MRMQLFWKIKSLRFFYLTNFVKKCKEHGNVGVLPGGSHNIQVAVLDEGEGALLRLDQRVHIVIIIQVCHKSYKIYRQFVYYSTNFIVY